MKRRCAAILAGVLTAMSALSFTAAALSVKVGEMNIKYELSSKDSPFVTGDTVSAAVLIGVENAPEAFEIPGFADTPDGRIVFTSIGDKAFIGTTGITSAVIPDTVDSIGDSAFAGCLSLERIALPPTVRMIGAKVFVSCTSLEYADLGSKGSELKAIPENCFSSCTNLAGVNIPYGVVGIGREAFYGCNAMKSIEIPASVMFIGENAIGLRTNRITGDIEPIPDFIIAGSKGTAAESYARGKGIAFIDTSSTPMGDVNGDGTADSSDASNVLQVYSEVSTGSESSFDNIQTYLADVNRDGQTDSSDASEILAIYSENATS